MRFAIYTIRAGTLIGWAHAMDASRRFGPLLFAVASFGLLAACGGHDAAPPGPRPVLVERAGAADGASVASYPGEVRAREESPLAFRIGGNLVRRHVDAGEAVKRGQLLAELDPGDQRLAVQAAQAQLSAASAELERVRADRERYAALVRDQLVSQSAMDAQEAAWKAAEERVRAARAELEVARNQAGYSQLLAPRDGVIASRQAEAGQVLAAGQTVFTLAADSGPAGRGRGGERAGPPAARQRARDRRRRRSAGAHLRRARGAAAGGRADGAVGPECARVPGQRQPRRGQRAAVGAAAGRRRWPRG